MQIPKLPKTELTLGGLIFLHLSFYCFAAGTKTISTYEQTLELVSGADFGATCNIIRAGARPKAAGARRGPPRHDFTQCTLLATDAVIRSLPRVVQIPELRKNILYLTQ